MLRFTIRDVLWLTALVAMGAGWYAFAIHKKAEMTMIEKKHRDEIFEYKARIFADETVISDWEARYSQTKGGLRRAAGKLEGQILDDRDTKMRGQTEAFLDEHVRSSASTAIRPRPGPGSIVP